MKSHDSLLMSLCFNINNLAPTIHAVGGIDPVRAEKGAIGRVLGQLRGRELIGSTALPGALLRLFAFWLCHDEKN